MFLKLFFENRLFCFSQQSDRTEVIAISECKEVKFVISIFTQDEIALKMNPGDTIFASGKMSYMLIDCGKEMSSKENYKEIISKNENVNFIRFIADSIGIKK